MDPTIGNAGAMGVPFKGRVVTTAETAEVDAVSSVMAIAGLGDTPNSTNSLWGVAFERFDSPQCGICKLTEEWLTILKRRGGGGMIMVSVVSPAQEACRSSISKGHLSGGDFNGGGILGALGKMCVDISRMFNT
ncbi:hypothetical protein L208DRAFT_1375110 [Tricholoma matsutake]|nr:hypothetical protein L208DRAFT_1375110 [Tricholoma matsutake 945]